MKKRVSLATAGGGGPPASAPITVLKADFIANVGSLASPFNAAARALLSPQDMAGLALLPDDHVIITREGSGAPLWAGAVWPHKKVERGVVKVPSLEVQSAAASHAPLSPQAKLPSSSPSKGAGTVSSSSASSYPVRVSLLTNYNGPAISVAGLVQIAQSFPPTLEAPPDASVDAVRMLLVGAIAPISPLAADHSGSCEPTVQISGVTYALRPCAAPSKPAANIDSDAQYLLIAGQTAFEGVPPHALRYSPVTAAVSSSSHGPTTAKQATSLSVKSAAIVGGLLAQQQLLRELISGALLHPQLFSAYGLRPPKGALLVGPPGTGKTLLAKAVTSSLGLPLVPINGPELMSSVVGESEGKIRALFSDAAAGKFSVGTGFDSGDVNAASPSPSANNITNAPPGVVIFIDEIDGLAPRRDGGAGGGGGEVEARVVAALLACMDGIDSDSDNSASSVSTANNHDLASPDTTASIRSIENLSAPTDASSPQPPKQQGTRVFVLAATNRASAVDPALRRPGRFDREISVPIPTTPERAAILRTCLAGYPTALSSDFPNSTAVAGASSSDTAFDAAVMSLAADMHGYVGADIAAVVREGALAALRRCMAASSTLYSSASSSSASSNSNSGDTGADTDAGVASLTAGLRGLSICHPSATSSAASSLAFDSRSTNVAITIADLRQGLARVQPSAIREIAVEVPTVRWSDIGGQEDVKQRLREAVEWPLTHPGAFSRLGIRPPRGVLLYGPPGEQSMSASSATVWCCAADIRACSFSYYRVNRILPCVSTVNVEVHCIAGCSKTMMAKAMASQGRMNFLAVKGPELLSKYVGDSEKAVAEVFARARAASPSIIFFDEFDSLAPSRSGGGGGGDGGGEGGSSVGSRVVSQLLTELDGISHLKQVVVVAATNRPDLIDAALLRPGRIDRMLYVGLPDAPARRKIIQLQLARVPHDPALLMEPSSSSGSGHTSTSSSSSDVTGVYVEGDASHPPSSAAGNSASSGGGSSGNLDELVALLDGYSGAEIVGIFRDAAVRAVSEWRARREAPVASSSAQKGSPQSDDGSSPPSLPVMCYRHVAQASAQLPRQVTPAMLAFYRRFAGHAL